MQLGDVELHLLVAERWKADGGLMFGVVPKVLWERQKPADGSNMIDCACVCLIARLDGRVIICETGIGNKLSEKRAQQVGLREPEGMLHALKGLGIRPDEVDAVVTTHLHWDHAGGLTRRDESGGLELTFPRARHFVQRSEWDFALHPDVRSQAGYVQDDFTPLADGNQLVELLDGDAEVLPGVHLRHVGGHTPGSQVLILRSGELACAVTGDLVCQTPHLKIPWNMSADIEPLRVFEQKARLFEEAEKHRWLLVLSHETDHPAGYLEEGGRWAARASRVVKLTTADGRKLTYRKLGHGPVLVCHPGGPGFSSSWFGDLAGLWERFTLVMVNPRGTGGSDRPVDPRAYQIHDYVSDLEELRHHLGLERMMLLGHSHGGVVAQAYAAEHPGRVLKLILCATLARFGQEQEAAMKAGMDKRSNQPWYPDAMAALEAEQQGEFASDEQLTAIVLRELPLYFARFGPVEAGYLDSFRGETINSDTLKLFNEEIFTSFDMRDRLPSITAPTLVMAGDEDFICGPICAAEISAGIPEARTVIVGDSGHQVFVEQPQAFHDEVSGFLPAS